MKETVDVLQALLGSSQEGLVSFLSMFTELCPSECALLALSEEQQQQKEGVSGEFASSGAPLKPVDNEIVGDVWRRFMERKGGNSSLGGPPGSQASAAARGVSFEFHAELEDIVIDETAACRTSSMTAFLDHGMTDVIPTVGGLFDNFQEELEDSKADELIVNDGAERATIPAVGKPLDGRGTEADEPTTVVEPMLHVVAPIDSPRDTESEISVSDIDLPGVGLRSGHEDGFYSSRCHAVLDAEEVDALRVDDDVRPFALDPYFDYEGRHVGMSVRIDPRSLMCE
uniref:Uncharacterized protein n=1 Tax=Trypanosoma congolense (strain IL3000) TaxID=1068625 RepID=G0UX69_TRYCI|nr:conserved hypothetical protein [Trypanosoma congolense IL3000]